MVIQIRRTRTNLIVIVEIEALEIVEEGVALLVKLGVVVLVDLVEVKTVPDFGFGEDEVPGAEGGRDRDVGRSRRHCGTDPFQNWIYARTVLIDLIIATELPIGHRLHFSLDSPKHLVQFSRSSSQQN